MIIHHTDPTRCMINNKSGILGFRTGVQQVPAERGIVVTQSCHSSDRWQNIYLRYRLFMLLRCEQCRRVKQQRNMFIG